MAIFTLCIDIDQYRLRPLFVDPNGGVSIVGAAAHLVPRRQLCLDLSLEVLVGRNQADRWQGFLVSGLVERLGIVPFYEAGARWQEKHELRSRDRRAS